MILARAKEVPCLVLTCFSAVAKNVPLHPLLSPQPLLRLHPKPKTTHPSHPPKLSQVKEKSKIHNLVHRFCVLPQKLKLRNLPCVSIVHLPHKCHFWWSCLWWCYSLQKLEKLRLSKLAQASRPLTDWAKRGGGGGGCEQVQLTRTREKLLPSSSCPPFPCTSPTNTKWKKNFKASLR